MMATRSRIARMMIDAQDYISLAQSRAMARAAHDRGRVRDALLITVLAESGRRICEIVPQSKYKLKALKKPHLPYPGLRPMDLDLNLGIGYFCLAKKRNPKGFVRLPFPMRKRLMIALIEYGRVRSIPTDQPFFPICTRTVERIVKKYATLAVPYAGARHPHALRHGLGVEMSRKARNPQDVMSIAQQLGHSDIAITQVYMRFSTQSLKELMKDTVGE
jgi:site-specific recombinase XerD